MSSVAPAQAATMGQANSFQTYLQNLLASLTPAGSTNASQMMSQQYLQQLLQAQGQQRTATSYPGAQQAMQGQTGAYGGMTLNYPQQSQQAYYGQQGQGQGGGVSLSPQTLQAILRQYQG